MLAGLDGSSWAPGFPCLPAWVPGAELSCENESWALLAAVLGGGGLRGGEFLKLGSLSLVSAPLHSPPGLSWASQPLSLPASLDRAAGEWWLLLCRALSPGKVAEVGETGEAVTSPV